MCPEAEVQQVRNWNFQGAFVDVAVAVAAPTAAVDKKVLDVVSASTAVVPADADVVPAATAVSAAVSAAAVSASTAVVPANAIVAAATDVVPADAIVATTAVAAATTKELLLKYLFFDKKYLLPAPSAMT